MRLLICTQIVDAHDPALGFFHQWIEEFSAHVESIQVICLKEGTHTLPRTVTVHSLGKESGAARITYLYRFYKYLWLHRRKYDVVFVHMNPEYVVLGGLLWRLMGKRIGLWYTHRSVNLSLRIAERFTHHIFSASRESFRLQSAKVSVVGHGIEPNPCTPRMSQGQTVRLVSVGRLSPVKNHALMFDVLEVLRHRGIDASLTLIGGPARPSDYTYEQMLRKDIAARSLAVELKGGLAHEAAIASLCEADIFINCSGTGSLDKAVLEAMAAGIPVVTSNEGMHDALSGVDPDALVVPSANSIADRISALTQCTSAERGARSIRYKIAVAQHHSLKALIVRILSELKS